MAIRATQEAISQIFYQRCFWLFAVLLLIGAVSFTPGSDGGRLALNAINVFVLIATRYGRPLDVD